MLKSALGYLWKNRCINEDDFTFIITVIPECARLLPNGRPGARGSYDLPLGDQHFKQGARTCA